MNAKLELSNHLTYLRTFGSIICPYYAHLFDFNHRSNNNKSTDDDDDDDNEDDRDDEDDGGISTLVIVAVAA